MIALGANKSIMRSKFPNNAFFEFQSHDQFVSQIMRLKPYKALLGNFDLMKNDKKFDLMSSTSRKSEF